MPADCIAELADYEYGFQNVQPRALMKHIEDDADAANIEDVEALLVEVLIEPSVLGRYSFAVSGDAR